MWVCVVYKTKISCVKILKYSKTVSSTASYKCRKSNLLFKLANFMSNVSIRAGQNWFERLAGLFSTFFKETEPSTHEHV